MFADYLRDDGADSLTRGISPHGSGASTSPTRPSLLLRVRNPQDAESWAAFVDVYCPLVFGHCRKRGLQHQDAEDVTQKVFTQITQSIRGFQYDPAVGRFRDWLGTVVRNAVNRFLHQASRDPTGANSTSGTRSRHAAKTRLGMTTSPTMYCRKR